MTKPVLVVMAAGIGSRYGGLKQIEPVGPNGEMIIDYSIYDALKAGFGKVVFIIKEDIEKEFRKAVGNRIEEHIDTAYVFQKISDIPSGCQIPRDRKKPWGTGHAVLCCRNVVNRPFAVINADDFYGPSSLRLLGEYLKNLKDKDGVYQYCMVGFKIENTLTEHGHVARGVCTVDSDGYLKEIHERTKIRKFGNIVKYAEDDHNWVVIPEGSTVSMNAWGFTPSLFGELEAQFPEFFERNRENILTAEYFLPDVVNRLISSNKAMIRVLTSCERWYGITYREDKPAVRQAIAQMIRQGFYPAGLWGGSEK